MWKPVQLQKNVLDFALLLCDNTWLISELLNYLNKDRIIKIQNEITFFFKYWMFYDATAKP